MTQQHSFFVKKNVNLSFLTTTWGAPPSHSLTNVIINALLDANADRKLGKPPSLFNHLSPYRGKHGSVQLLDWREMIKMNKIQGSTYHKIFLLNAWCLGIWLLILQCRLFLVSGVMPMSSIPVCISLYQGFFVCTLFLYSWQRSTERMSCIVVVLMLCQAKELNKP